jgi:GNAT superfamily N-acetyltransferase
VSAAVLTLTDAPGADAIAAVEGGLSRYNREQAGYWDSRALAVLVSDAGTQAVVGGILGRTLLGLCFLDLVFLPEGLRGSGVGSAIMRQAEDEARRRGCRVRRALHDQLSGARLLRAAGLPAIRGGR